ncbi:MAG: isochorismatase family protein [Oscillospiraceae bacterium]|nr:isochorismatase family protein [Oscillospiraceae bacterium]
MILLVIDVQKGITDDRLCNFGKFCENSRRIIGKARSTGTEIIFFRHDDGPGTGFSVGDSAFEIAEQFAPAEGEKVFDKSINSCFGNKDFCRYLSDISEDTLMIVGLQTDLCIDATVKSAFERGFRVIVPAGCNSTFDNAYIDKETSYRYYNEMIWQGRYAECVTLDDALRMIEDSEKGT